MNLNEIKSLSPSSPSSPSTPPSSPSPTHSSQTDELSKSSTNSQNNIVETRISTPTFQVTSKQEMLMQSLTKFFKKPENLAKMIPIITQSPSSKISLRLFDWFVTNYSKRKNVSYFIEETKNGREQNRYFNVFLHYKNQLRAYSKQQFDPFCRKWKIIKKQKVYCGIKFYYETTQTGKKKFIETTVGQLNFFKWAISNKVLDYIIENFNEIAKDMIETATKKKPKATKKVGPSKTETDSKTEPAQKTETKNVKADPEVDATKKTTKGVNISASKQLTKRHVSIIVDFN